MLRTAVSGRDGWSDKVMSVLREQQLEACQDRLSRCVARDLFSDLCEDEADRLFAASFYAMECHGRKMQLEELREKVLSRVKREACFLTPREDDLVKRMLIGDGETPLMDWDEISAAEALISRLWCTIGIVDDETAVLRLSPALMQPITDAMTDAEYPRVRRMIFSFDATLHSLLYLSGFLHAAVPMEHFRQQWTGDDGAKVKQLVARYLRAAFDYTETPQGDIILLHPGLADPERLLSGLSGMESTQVHLTREMMLGGMNEVLPEERASFAAMRGELCGAVRPELDEGDVLEDLRMMAKQGATLSEMREVLENALCVLPSPRMLSCLSQLHAQTVRWLGMAPAVLN